jgi:hypothetical protein
MRHLELLQQGQVLLAEGSPRMVPFLIVDVADHGIQLRMRIGKSTKSFLSGEPSVDPLAFVDVVGATRFDVTHQIGERHIWFQPDQDVRVVRHAMHRQQLLFLAGDDAGDVFMEFLLPLRPDEVLPSFDRKDHLDVDLALGVGHGSCRSTEIVVF